MNKLFWVVVAVIFAVVGHLSYVLFIPEYQFAGKFEANQDLSGPTRFIVLDQARANKVFPSSDPGLVNSVCSFDLSNGQLKIEVAAIATYWSLSIYSAKGDSYYSINDRQANRAKLQIEVGSPGSDQGEDGKKKPRKIEKDKAFIVAPSNRGWAVLRLQVVNEASRHAIVAAADRFSCKMVGK